MADTATLKAITEIENVLVELEMTSPLLPDDISRVIAVIKILELPMIQVVGEETQK